MYLQDTKLFRLSLAVAKGCDSMDKIELRLMNEDTKIYSIFFDGETIGKTVLSNLYKPTFQIKVCKNNTEMEKQLKLIGGIFSATFYLNNTEIISGIPMFTGNEFVLFLEKNPQPCLNYGNCDNIVIKL